MRFRLPRAVRISIRTLSVLALLSLPGPTAGAGVPTMGVDKLQRGMLGVGRTVFHGTRIDTFRVEVLGVLRNVFGPKTDIILARLSGDPIEKTGGIAGMSGSPVYVDGRLIGAVAYGWSFSIEPIMGITPIDDMLGILDRSDPESTRSSAGTSSPNPPGMRGIEIPRFSDTWTENAIPSGEMRPVRTPVYLSGFAAEVVPDLRDRLSAFGLMPVQGGGGLDTTLARPTLAPGSALGVQLIRGDFNMTAIGTLTHIDGDRLVGFGHPMLFSGTTRLPMTSAFIHDVVPSQFQSFKLGVAVEEVGAITQDRAPGIGGQLGAEAEMMPVRIGVTSPSHTEAFRMEVLENRELGPLLIQSAVVSSVVSAEKARGEVTVKTAMTLSIDGREDLTLHNIYSGSRGLGQGVLGVTRPIQLLLRNPFHEISIRSVDFDLEVLEEVQAARIESITLGRSRFEAGDAVSVAVHLRPYLASPRTLETSVVIPEHFRQGTLILRVSSARAHAAQESKRVPGRYDVDDVDAMIRLLEAEHPNNTLIVELLANRAGATVDGLELPSLPPSVVRAMQSARRSGSIRPVNQTVLTQSVVKTDFVLSGQSTVFLGVGADGPALRFAPGSSGSTQKKK